MTIWICPSEFIICKQDWREREIRKASSMAGMAKEKERKIEEKATQPKSLCFPPLYFSEKKMTIRKTCAKIIFQYFIKKVSESIKTSGKTSVPVISGNQRTKLRASSPSNFLLMAVFTTWTCWGKHFGIISKKDVPLPRDHSKRRKKALPSGSQKKEESIDKSHEKTQLLEMVPNSSDQWPILQWGKKDYN